jgi:hypothetical protein
MGKKSKLIAIIEGRPACDNSIHCGLCVEYCDGNEDDFVSRIMGEYAGDEIIVNIWFFRGYKVEFRPAEVVKPYRVCDDVIYRE